MKRVKSSKSTTIQAVALSREDIDSIFDIMRAACGRVRIESGEFEYNSLDELQDKVGDAPSALSLNGHDPVVYITIKRTWMDVGIVLGHEGSDAAEGAALRVQQVLNDHKRKVLTGIFSCPGLFIVVLLFIGSLLLLPSQSYIWPLLGAAMMVFVFVNAAIKYGAFTVISLCRRHERPSFLSRNKDKLLLIVITAVITAIITTVVTRVFPHLMNNLFGDK